MFAPTTLAPPSVAPVPAPPTVAAAATGSAARARSPAVSNPVLVTSASASQTAAAAPALATVRGSSMDLPLPSAFRALQTVGLAGQQQVVAPSNVVAVSASTEPTLERKDFVRSSSPAPTQLAPVTAALLEFQPPASASAAPTQLAPVAVAPVRLGSREDPAAGATLIARQVAQAPVAATTASSSAPPLLLASTTSPRARAASPAPRAASPARMLRELPNAFSEIISAAPLGYGGSLKPHPQVHPLPAKFDEAPPGSPQRRSDEYSRDRRPTDPFFYPTTVMPLTCYGLDAIDQTTPPKIGPLDPPLLHLTQASGVGSREEAPLFVNAPLQSFVEQPEEMRALQEQNDSLARQIQQLEHAKSLAAVQSAQALQKIRTRQDQLQREAQQAFQRAKELQAEFQLPSFEFGASSTGDLRLDSVPVAQPAPAAEETRAHAAGHSHSSSHGHGGHSAALAHERAGHYASTPPPHLASAERGPAQVNNEWLRKTTSSSQGETPQGSPPHLHSVRLPGSENHRAQEGWNGADAAAQAPAIASPKLGAPFDPPNNISAMANRILSTHNVPSTLVNGTPYVDAMGNPLGPTHGRELPNIKDDTPAPLPDLHGHERQHPSHEALGAAGQGGFGAQMQVQASSSQQLLAALELQAPRSAQRDELESGRGMLMQDAEGHLRDVLPPPPLHHVHERAAPVTGMAHEQAPPSARAPQASVEAAMVEGGAGAGAGAGPPGSVAAAETSAAQTQPVPATPPQQQQQHHQSMAGGAADAAAGSAVSPPPAPEPPQIETPVAGRSAVGEDPPSSQRQPRRDHSTPADSGTRGRRRADEDRPTNERRANSRPAGGSNAAATEEASASQLRNLPPDPSEELQAELEECLDMIRWCGENLKESLQDLKGTTRPQDLNGVKEVLETVSLLLGQPETRWDKLKRLIGSPTFLERVQRLSFQQSITRETFRKLRDRLQHPNFDEEQIKSVCVPVVPLAIWCRAIGVYLSKTRFRGGPEIRPVAGAGAAVPPPPQPREQQQERLNPAAYIVFEPDLNGMSPEELRCVQNLTISRPDVGTITFHGPTDCNDLDFGRIVRLEIGEVLVYPDSSVKPEVGVGLNKAATVTMYQCWPPNGRSLLQDQKSQERYKKKIKQMTEEKHAKFLDYDCNTGLWKFSVEHF